MIHSLEELNNVINDVVNRIVEVSTSRTMSSNYYASYEHVDDLITKEDFLKYFDLIAEELCGREEVLDLEITEDHEFNAVFGTAWCPMYEGHEEDFVIRRVFHPLSITRKAEILDNAMRNIQSMLKDFPEDRLNEVAELFGVSVEDLAKLDLPAAKEAVERAEEITEQIAEQRAQRDFSRPIEFELLVNSDLLQRKICGSFEEALAAYESVQEGVEKELYCQTYRFQQIAESNMLMRSNGDGKDWVNDFIVSNDPHVILAGAKAVLARDPVNKEAWERLNYAETRVGVTGHRMEDGDLKVGNWRIHLVPPNGKYGVNDGITNDSGKFLVEFYDLRYIHPEFSPNGQFTGGRYYADTLLGKDGWGSGDYPHGLCLDGDIPAWTVTGPQMTVVLDFVRQETAPKERTSLADLISAAECRASEPPHVSVPEKDDRGI